MFPIIIKSETATDLLFKIKHICKGAGATGANFVEYISKSYDLPNSKQLWAMRSRLTTYVLHADQFGTLSKEPWATIAGANQELYNPKPDFTQFEDWQQPIVKSAYNFGIVCVPATKVDDNRPILIGKYELMRQVIKNVDDEFDKIIDKEPKPITMFDQNSKLIGFHTINCINCQFFTAHKECAAMKSKTGDLFELNQNNITDKANGGCFLHKRLPGFSNIVKVDADFSSIGSPGFDTLSFAVLSEVRDNKLAVYKNGKYLLLDPSDLKIEIEREPWDGQAYKDGGDEPDEVC